MAKHLTALLLREATDYLWDGVTDRIKAPFPESYMCWALGRASEARYGLLDVDVNAMDEFEQLLADHGVSVKGFLENDHGVDVWNMTKSRRQALRFDFMNLLAHSLDRPRRF